jgi:hypothetical protein
VRDKMPETMRDEGARQPEGLSVGERTGH